MNDISKSKIPVQNFKIVIIEDDESLSYLIKKNLSREGFPVFVEETGKEGIERVKKEKPSLILLDYRLSDLSGEQIITKLRNDNINVPFIIMTGFGDEKIAVEMMKLGAIDYLVKDQNFIDILLPVILKVKTQIEVNEELSTTKKNLHETEIKYKALIENSVDLILIFDVDFNLKFASPSVGKTLLIETDELIGSRFKKYINQTQLKNWEKMFYEFIDSGESNKEVAFFLNDSKDNIHYLEGTFSNMLNVEGIIGIVVNLKDSTQRYLAEDLVRKLSSAVKQSSIGIVITDSEGIIEYVNPYYCKITGYDENELIGKTPRILKSGYTSKSTYEFLWRQIKSGKEFKGEFKNKKKNGELFWENITITPLLDKNDVVTHYLAVKEDITEKKEFQKKLEEANDFYLKILEDSPALIWRTNSKGERDYFNQTWLKFRGVRIDQEFHFGWLDGIHPDDVDMYKNIYFESLSNRTSFICSYKLRKNTGEYRWITEFAKPFYDLNSEYKGFIGTCLDTTEIKEAEEAMRIAKETAERSEKMKTEFLAQISHEIRTPINSILNFSSLLKFELENSLSDDLKESFKIIDRAGRRLIRTVDLLLHMSEIHTGNYEINMKKVNLEKDILENVIISLSQQAKANGLKFKYLNKIGDIILVCDEFSVSQIFENLIDNAIKYSKKGDIEITAYLNELGEVAVDVKDQGIGISKEFIPDLFKPFSQEETGYTRKFEGNGLGLALVKKYCELNNARIDVKSQKGVGSTFTITFEKQKQTESVIS